MVPFLLVLSCEINSVQEKPAVFPGTVRIETENRFFTMGSGSYLAGIDEKPPMCVGFTYNFYLDTTEVTVADYWQVMHELPEHYTPADTVCTEPVCFVTWYDAVLFCNQRSRRENLDTVYSYISVEKTAAGRTYRINGLREKLEKTGYRLPTEAEWEFAARGGSTTEFTWGNEPDTFAARQIAWYGGTAGDKPHQVARLDCNRYGLFDMFGNCAEWVNDWKGVYFADTVINDIGPATNDMDDRPVKGGSFVHTIDRLRPSSRSDDYRTHSSMAVEYIGFRCAVGAITASGTAPVSTLDTINPVLLSGEPIRSFLSGRNAGLVFVNITGNTHFLCYVDYSATTPGILQYTDFSPVFAPTISPDGKWVAFCTRDEGSRDGSEIYIRHLDANGSHLHKCVDAPAFIPRWWVDPQTADTFIVYTTSAVMNSSTEWKTTGTYLQKIAGGVPVGTPLPLSTTGSFHGGLSSDGQYMATGYPSLIMRNRSDNETKTLFSAPGNGKKIPDTSQVCNVSISPDAVFNNRAMFLDFGSGSTPSSLVGSIYYTHEIIFITDFSGTTVAWYPCPPELNRWEFPEWSNQADFAVAAASTVASPQNCSRIHLINLKDTLYCKCIEGYNLAHPYLWISPQPSSGKSPAFNPDSAGHYNDPPSTEYQKGFSVLLPHFWKCSDSIEILSLGSSRIHFALNPLTNPRYYGFNFSYSAAGLLGEWNILKDYALPHCPNLKVVALSLDICWFPYEGGDRSWTSDMAQTKGYNYDRTNDFWKTGFPEGFIDHTLSLPEPNDNNYKSMVGARGWVSSPSNGWGPMPPFTQPDWESGMNQYCTDNLQLVKTLAEELEQRSIHCVAILCPQSPGYRTTGAYGCYGPATATAQTIVAQLQNIADTGSFFHLYDAHQFGNHDYVESDFWDDSHLSTDGAMKFSSRFNALVDSILAR